MVLASYNSAPLAFSRSHANPSAATGLKSSVREQNFGEVLSLFETLLHIFEIEQVYLNNELGGVFGNIVDMPITRLGSLSGEQCWPPEPFTQLDQGIADLQGDVCASAQSRG